MDNLKFGDEVIAWDDDKSESFTGKFVYVESDKGFYEKPYVVLLGQDNLESFKNCKLKQRLEAGQHETIVMCGFNKIKDKKDEKN